MSALVTSEIFRLLVNTLTPDDNYSRRYMQISDKNFKGLYLKKEWLFFVFLLHFWNVHGIYKIPKKNKSILAQLLPKLFHPKKMFT